MTKYLDLTGLQTYDGLIKEHIQGKINALDYTIAAANHTDGKAVVAVTEADGIIAVTEGNVKANYVTVDWGTEDPVSTTANVQAALDEVYTKLGQTSDGAAITVWNNNAQVANGAIAADGTTYTIKQGDVAVATFNVARDMVVSSGSVVTATGSETDVPQGVSLTAGQKYVRLVIANATDGKNIYIAVNDLVDVYTAASGASKVQLAISNSNVISADIVAGSIAKTDLTTALQNEISAAATVVNAKSTGHVLVTVTPASGANPAEVTVTEDDIASAADLSGEITRAKAAEAGIDTAVGLTKASGAETRSITPTTNYGTVNSVAATTVMANMQNIDTQLKTISDVVTGLTAITSAEISDLFA